MDAKPVFDCLLAAFLFGELLRLDFMGTLQRCVAQLLIRNCSSMLPSSGFYFAKWNEVRPAHCQINITLLPDIRMISTHYEKLATGLGQIAKLEISLKNAICSLYVFNFEVQFPVLQMTDSSEQCFVCFFETQPALPRFIRQNENRIVQHAGANSKFKLQLTSGILSINIRTLPPQHCRVLKIIRGVWHGWDWHIYRNSSAVTPPNTRLNHKRNCPIMPIILYTD